MKRYCKHPYHVADSAAELYDIIFEMQREGCLREDVIDLIQKYEKQLLLDFTPKVYEFIAKPPFKLEHSQHGIACEKFGDTRTEFIIDLKRKSDEYISV
jgi:hypothetical protein